jgi:threonine synthase
VLGALSHGDIPAQDLTRIITHAYEAFRHRAVCPLVQLEDNLFVLELFHGPTLAFKDVAMRFLAGAMDHELRRRGQRATIVGATSGDTGSAAIDAFKGSSQVDIFILYPHGRVSEVQRRQMTTAASPNVHAMAINGTFDDCQALVKGMFNHLSFRDELVLSGVNSINWARIVAQATYYFTAAAGLGAPHRQVAFSVPTGNFGNVLAGWVAKRMGLPISHFVVGANANDIMARVLETGHYTTTGVVPTVSPSMDIQISSNFERLLFEAYGRDPAAIRGLMGGLKQAGAFAIADAPLRAIQREFSGCSTDDARALAEMRAVWKDNGYMLDPHTAVGTIAGRKRLKVDPGTPMVVLGTAHPAKFPDAVERAIGVRPALPPHMADLMERREDVSLLANDQSEVERFIRDRARAVRVS